MTAQLDTNTLRVPIPEWMTTAEREHFTTSVGRWIADATEGRMHPAWCDLDRCQTDESGTYHGRVFLQDGSVQVDAVAFEPADDAGGQASALAYVEHGSELTAPQARAVAAALSQAADALEVGRES